MRLNSRLGRLERREPDCPDCAPGGLITFEIADVRPIGSPREEKPEPRFCPRCGRPALMRYQEAASAAGAALLKAQGGPR